jgi:DNA-binding response OmpR family regulator
MYQKRILFADNDPDFRATRAEFLQKKGYHVLFAGSPDDAERMLDETNIHLAILDIRLVNDDNEKDISGVLLAQNDEFRNVPKIILTGFPSPYTSRDVLRLQPSGFQPAVNYVDKKEGQEALIEAVEDAFARQVHINWSLDVDWKACDSFTLVRMIEPNLEGERLLSRADEMKDLLRRLFYEKDHIRIDRLLWRRNGRTALIVLAFSADTKPESFVVVCGQNAIVNEEANRFEKFAPDAPGRTGTKLNAKAATTHFASNSYSFTDNELENCQTLSELYRFAPPKVFRDTLNTLFRETLWEWHQDKPIQEQRPLDVFYRERLDTLRDSNFVSSLEGSIRAIAGQIAILRLRMEPQDGKLRIHFDGQSFSFVDPLPFFADMLESVDSTLAINVPGMLTGENILADQRGRTWLTDFAEAGMAPLLWNYVALESVIRFDWVDTSDLLRRKEIEECLVNTDFAKPDLRDLETNLRKHAQAIATLRKLAARTVGQNVWEYHMGILLQAAHRLAAYQPGSPLTTMELTRLVHMWLAMAMIVEKITRERAHDSIPHPKTFGKLRILDETARIVQVGDQEVRLPPQPFVLFKYLFAKANQVCTKEELLQDALQSKYEENYLPTLIGRIRKAIEEDAEQPRYLITEPNAGYRLILNPK